ncbi:protein unc-93 homolog A-like isoform X2 [Ptychodera flava]|uniref:protein unc-93 homolog A-like isoform X2 n=1 Tax=Ptychodera flava TaxID=63121 RepID=UPI003969C197
MGSISEVACSCNEAEEGERGSECDGVGDFDRDKDAVAGKFETLLSGDEKQLDNNLNAKERRSRKRLMKKNLLVTSAAFLFLFTAFRGLQNLQSTINCIEGLGLASLATVYFCMVLSCLFLPPLAIRYLDAKWTIAACMSCFVLYTAMNFYPQWYTLIPAAALLGAAAAPLWAAQFTHTTTTGIRYAALSRDDSDAVVNRFFGIFFMFFQSSMVWGSLLSSTVLQSGSSENNSTADSRATYTYTCGAKDCQRTSGNETTYCNPPPDDVKNILLGAFLFGGVIAVGLITIGLDNLKKPGKKNNTKKSKFQLFLSTLKLMKTQRMIFIIPMSFYGGLDQAFVAGDFTKSYISCALGVDMVGYILICYGVGDTIFSLLVGRVAKYTGRVALVTTAALINLILFITLLLWDPTTRGNLVVFFWLAAVWGLADAIWRTQLSSKHSVRRAVQQQAGSGLLQPHPVGVSRLRSGICIQYVSVRLGEALYHDCLPASGTPAVFPCRVQVSERTDRANEKHRISEYSR